MKSEIIFQDHVYSREKKENSSTFEYPLRSKELYLSTFSAYQVQKHVSSQHEVYSTVVQKVFILCFRFYNSNLTLTHFYFDVIFVVYHEWVKAVE